MIFYTKVPMFHLSYSKQVIPNFGWQMELISFSCNWDFLIVFWWCWNFL